VNEPGVEFQRRNRAGFFYARCCFKTSFKRQPVNAIEPISHWEVWITKNAGSAGPNFAEVRCSTTRSYYRKRGRISPSGAIRESLQGSHSHGELLNGSKAADG
jgi:hypothetical protein